MEERTPEDRRRRRAKLVDTVALRVMLGLLVFVVVFPLGWTCYNTSRDFVAEGHLSVTTPLGKKHTIQRPTCRSGDSREPGFFGVDLFAPEFQIRIGKTDAMTPWKVILEQKDVLIEFSDCVRKDIHITRPQNQLELLEVDVMVGSVRLDCSAEDYRVQLDLHEMFCVY